MYQHDRLLVPNKPHSLDCKHEKPISFSSFCNQKLINLLQIIRLGASMVRISSIFSNLKRYIPRAVKHSKGFESCDFSKKILFLEYVHYNTE